MDDRIVKRPTLIVGVGGVGCEIAEGAYRLARASGLAKNDRLAVIGFDTDVNDLQKRRGVDARNIVQTSSVETVFRIIESNPDAEKTFCLTRADIPNRVLNMRLIEGAGQIRMLSHLALWDTLAKRADMLESTVGNVLRLLARHDGRSEYAGSLNVIVCGSLAGATGSGMAMQVALLLRQLAANIAAVEVRGLFLLPDVFVRAANLGSQQIDNVLSNGYAALKELNAVIARADNFDAARGFSFEYGPGRTLREGETPFSAVTFIDYENLVGGNLGVNLDNYKLLATRMVYQQTFTSIGTETLSRTINDAPAGIAASARGSSNVFSAVGIAAVRYPADHVVDYLTHRFAQDVLTGDWLRLDRVFQDEVRRYEELKAAGNLAQRGPDVSVTYLESLAQFARRDKLTFFRDIDDRLNPKLVDKETGDETISPLHRQFIDSFLAEMSGAFWANARLGQIKARSPIDPAAFRHRDRIESTVRQSEALLDADFQAIETALSDQPSRLFTNMITLEDDKAPGDLRPHDIQFHIVRGGPHPVQVRAFIYEAIAVTREMASSIDVDALRKAVLHVGDVFRDDDLSEAREDMRRGNIAVLDKARQAAQPSVFGRVVGATGKFVDEYVRYYDDTTIKLRAYGEGALQRRSLDALLVELQALAATWEGLFAEVGRSLAAIDDRARRLELVHARDESFDGNVYVYADLASKQSAWTELKQRSAGSRQSDAVNAVLNAAVFKQHRTDRRAREATKYSALRALFETEVVEKFAAATVEENHRSVWDVSVIEAIRREAKLRDFAWQARLQQAVDLVKAQAVPYVRLQDAASGQTMIFWAMPPSIRADHGDSDAFDRLFTFEQGERPLEAEDFSSRELLCVNSRVNLELAHFSKLAPGSGRGNVNDPQRGRYFQAYAARVSKLLDEEIEAQSAGGARRPTSVLTPHIHRDWHRASFLPEIFPESRRLAQSDLQRAAVVALGLGLLQKTTEYNRAVAYFTTIGRLAPHSIREPLLQSHDLWAIYCAFRDRADLQRATNGVWEAEKAALRAEPLGDSAIVKAVAGSESILRVLEMAAPRDGERDRREAAAMGLFQARRAALGELADILLPQLAPEGRLAEIAAYDGQATAEAFRAFAASPLVQPPTVDQLRAVFEAGTRRAAA